MVQTSTAAEISACACSLVAHAHCTLAGCTQVIFIPIAFVHLLILLVSRKMEFLLVLYLFLKNPDGI